MSRISLWLRLFGGKPQQPATEDGPAPLTVAEITGTLSRNMEAVEGDFSMEGIQKLENPVPMPVLNSGTELLELWLEPFGQDYWLQPGESFVVTSYGSWSGHPFEVAHEPGRIEIWATSWFATVTFPDGTEVPGGHQRPDGTY
ncbi:hypothetical protein ACFW6F_32030 [Streptomyces sp. NPDC058746]|uniref:hypothetical protein n=1 Tax=Streptomyces sp. NPDC058746 TaxID=3346622 RepID=UPI0036B04773